MERIIAPIPNIAATDSAEELSIALRELCGVYYI
jgi:hypothetical protein